MFRVEHESRACAGSCLQRPPLWHLPLPASILAVASGQQACMRPFTVSSLGGGGAEVPTRPRAHPPRSSCRETEAQVRNPLCRKGNLCIPGNLLSLCIPLLPPEAATTPGEVGSSPLPPTGRPRAQTGVLEAGPRAFPVTPHCPAGTSAQETGADVTAGCKEESPLVRSEDCSGAPWQDPTSYLR